MENAREKIFWGLLRLSMGWLMLWAFLDKLFGLGFNSCVDAKTGAFLGVMCKQGAWLAGASPTFGFLQFATKGPLADIFKAMAGSQAVDWLFMTGLLLIGLAMILGIGVRIAGYSGALMYLLMYLAGFIPPEHNPFLDEHIVNAMIFIGLASVRAGRFWGLGNWWANTGLVKKYPILE